MHRSFRLLIIGLLIIGGSITMISNAQSNNRVGYVRVDAPSIEIKRINTERWIPIRIETLVSTGDEIRVLQNGQGTLTFLDSILSLDLRPGMMLFVAEAKGGTSDFSIHVQIASNAELPFVFSEYRARRTLSIDPPAFILDTPGFRIHVLAGIGKIRIEKDGRTSVIMVTDGEAQVTDSIGNKMIVSQGTGVRANKEGPLSDVIPATSFEMLDSGLDGCPSQIILQGDVRVNVRLGASTDYPRIGNLDTNTPIQVMGVTQDNKWYRIPFKGGYGWIAVDALPISKSCAGIRTYPNHAGPENVELFSDLTETITFPPAPTAEATPAS